MVIDPYMLGGHGAGAASRRDVNSRDGRPWQVPFSTALRPYDTADGRGPLPGVCGSGGSADGGGFVESRGAWFDAELYEGLYEEMFPR